ncbi:hypothetical protein NECAME_15796 [Necator americanus]|uniref:Uncharacterized protein n=1 Tax=Necator americanus TaxID=51031 RepID=W2SI93_NECAM|nr:hypothetical protein NECAME_15796 [Necator americanus]ETN68477.1 hypothetical protein NECAME_15796 [Necator americanus]
MFKSEQTASSVANRKHETFNNLMQFVSLLPTMVPTALFSSFGEDDYNQEDSGDDSDSEEPSEAAKEEAPVAEEPKKDGK